MRLTLSLILLMFAFSSCKEENFEKVLRDQWIINSLQIDNTEYMDCIANVLTIEENGKVFFPRIDASCISPDRTLNWSGTVRKIKEPDVPCSVVIDSDNSILDDTFDVKFNYREKDNIIELIMYSNQIYLKAEKKASIFKDEIEDMKLIINKCK